MNSDIHFLITILYDEQLLRCVLTLDQNKIPRDVSEYPMEAENKKILHDLLPLHVKSCGPIVDVSTDIFEVHKAMENTTLIQSKHGWIYQETEPAEG